MGREREGSAEIDSSLLSRTGDYPEGFSFNLPWHTDGMCSAGTRS